MEAEAIKEQISEWMEARLLKEPDYFLVDIKMPGVNRLQVFVDGNHGITVDKCAEFSRYLERLIDEDGLLGRQYVLEVSSPGIDNPLKVLRQYERRIGSRVNVVKKDGQRFDGVLKSVNQEKITLDNEIMQKNKLVKTELLEIPFSEIKRTKLNFNFKKHG